MLCATYLFQLGGAANEGLGLVASTLQELKDGLPHHIMSTRTGDDKSTPFELQTGADLGQLQ
jgi:hypothetical protein